MNSIYSIYSIQFIQFIKKKEKRVRATPGLCGPKTFVVLLCCCKRPKWDSPGLPEKRFPPWMKGVVCHPDLRCVRIGSHLNVLTECFSTSQGTFSLGIRAGSLPREASRLSPKSRLPDFACKCLSPWDFCRLRVHRSLRRA